MMSRIISFLFLLSISIPSFGATALYFKSESGDYIGAGQEKLYTDADFKFKASRNYDNGVSFSINNFDTAPWGSYEWWYLDMAAPNEMLLQVGAYEGAMRYPFQDYGKPGLTLAGNGRGCNRSYGRFDVLEAVYGSNGDVLSFAADFEQHCEQPTAPALYGQIRYNSNIPISGPLRAKITLESVLNAKGCVEARGPGGADVTANGLASRDSSGGTDLSYYWQTTTGVISTDPRLTIPVGVGQTVGVQLTVKENSTGNTSTTSTPVCVSDSVAPTVTILSPAAGSVLVGDGFSVDVEVSDLVDAAITAYQLEMGLVGQYSLDPATGTGSVRMMKSATGTDPVPVTLKVTARDASGNVGVTEITVYKAHDASYHSPNR